MPGRTNVSIIGTTDWNASANPGLLIMLVAWALG